LDTFPRLFTLPFVSASAGAGVTEKGAGDGGGSTTSADVTLKVVDQLITQVITH
jgi:hypothetical protein